MSEAYRAALERIILVGGESWPGAVGIAKAALDDGVDFTEDNPRMAAYIRRLGLEREGWDTPPEAA